MKYTLSRHVAVLRGPEKIEVEYVGGTEGWYAAWCLHLSTGSSCNAKVAFLPWNDLHQTTSWRPFYALTLLSNYFIHVSKHVFLRAASLNANLIHFSYS